MKKKKLFSTDCLGKELPFYESKEDSDCVGEFSGKNFDVTLYPTKGEDMTAAEIHEGIHAVLDRIGATGKLSEMENEMLTVCLETYLMENYEIKRKTTRRRRK